MNWQVEVKLKAPEIIRHDNGIDHTVAMGADRDFDFAVGQCLPSDENSAC